MTMEFEIEGRPIGVAHPPYVIAEMSGNHNGDMERALRLIEVAKASGADAVKIQTYTAETLTIDHDGPDFTIESGPWAGRTLYDLYQEAATPWDWHEALFAKAREQGITIFSTPFDSTAVELLEGLEVPAYKIASFELLDLAWIEKVAATGKPMIMSTGMAVEQEIGEAVATARKAGCSELALLQCVSCYPADPKDSNLRTIADMMDRFEVVAGLSDHTPGLAVAVTALALGASLVDKPVTPRPADGGPDAAFSLEPEELSQLCISCKTASDSLGRVSYERTESEKGPMVFRRSLYIVEDVDAGTVLSEKHVRSIRPGYGLPVKYLPEILGQTAIMDLKRGDPLAWNMVRPGKSKTVDLDF